MTLGLPGVPPGVRRRLQKVLSQCEIVPAPTTQVDVVLLFETRRRALEESFRRWRASLAPTGSLWLVWPKRSSGVESDLTDRSVREIGLSGGLVDVKVCALTGAWSGLKFVVRRNDR